MQKHPDLTVDLPDEAATDRLGAALARLLGRRDTVLLAGPIGAGKSHLARALIRARLGRAEDVPSPSFTLVQAYDGQEGEIWHADLYRLSHPDEIAELGLEAAFGQALCLVEWPDRLGDLVPPGALTLTLAIAGEGRQARLAGQGDILSAVQAAMAEAAA
jgi:tRNA threonylcarbamoyladenosine biosynthesis protein TsaE